MASVDKNLVGSLKLVIKLSTYLDTDDKLLNAIVEYGIDGLDQFREDIAPKVFKTLELKVNEVLQSNNKCKQESGKHSEKSQRNLYSPSREDPKIDSNLYQDIISKDAIKKLLKQKERFHSMPDCLEKNILKTIYFIRLKLLPDNKITSQLKLEATQKYFDIEICSLKERLAIEEINLSNEVKECLKNTISLIEIHNFDLALKHIESLLKQIRPLDINEMVSLIEKGREKSKLLENQDVILLLGMTGSGKTASIHFFFGSKMILQKIEIQPGEFLNHITSVEPIPEALINFVISGRAESETKYINPVQINLKNLGELTDKFITLCDSPGFGDTGGPEADIANGLSILEGIRFCKSVRPVIMMNYENQGGRGEGIRDMTYMLQDMIINIEDYLSSFSYLFTKYRDIDVHASLLNIHLSIEKNHSEYSDQSFKAVLEDMIMKTKNARESLDILSHDPLSILKEIIKKSPIADPYRVFKQTITERSKNALYMQAEYNKSAIICATNNSDYILIGYRLNELIFLIKTLKLNDVKQILTETINFVKTHIIRNYEEAIERLNRCLENENKVSSDDLDDYFSRINKFKDLHVFKDIELLANVSGLDEALVQNFHQKCVQESINFKTLNIFQNEYSKTCLHNLKIFFQKCENPGYADACQYVIEQVNMIQEKLEYCIEKCDFSAAANYLHLSKSTILKFSDHTHLESEITHLYKKQRNLIFSKFIKVSDKWDTIFKQENLSDSDFIFLNNSLQTLENTKQINLLCEHIPLEELNNNYEVFVSKIVSFFVKLNDEVIKLLKNKNFKEIEHILKQMKSVLQISCIEKRITQLYHSTIQNIDSIVQNLKEETERLMNNINDNSADYNKILSNLKQLTDAEWINTNINKHGCYDDTVKSIRNSLINQAFVLFEMLQQTNLDLDSYLELEKVSKIMQQLDRLKIFQTSVPELQDYCDQSFEYFNRSFEENIACIRKIFNLEKHSMIRIKKQLSKLNSVKKEFQMMQPCFLFLKSEQFNSIEDVEEMARENINSLNENKGKLNFSIIQQAAVNNIPIIYCKKSKPQKKQILKENNFTTIDEVIKKQNEIKVNILELNNKISKNEQQSERLQMIQSKFNILLNNMKSEEKSIEFISKTKYKNEESLNYKIQEVNRKIKEFDIHEYIFEHFDFAKAETALNYINSCQPIKFINKKVSICKTESNQFLSKYKEFITSDLNGCLNQIQTLTSDNSFFAHDLAQRIKFRLEDCVRIQNCTLLNNVIQSQHIKKEIVERLSNYYMIIDSPGSDENLKAEIVKAFIQLDKFSEDIKYFQLYYEYNKNKIKELDELEKNIMDCIEKYKYKDVAMNLFEVDQKLLKMKTLNKIKTNLSISIEKILKKTINLSKVLGNGLEKKEVNQIVKQLKKLECAKNYLYNDPLLQEKFKSYSIFDQSTKDHLITGMKYIQEAVLKKILKYMSCIEFLISNNNFYKAEKSREHLNDILVLVENNCNTGEISSKIEAFQQNLEEAVNRVVKKYESIQISSYFQNSPKNIIEEIETLVKHTSNAKYIELLNKTKETIKNQMCQVFLRIKKANPDERSESMELIKATLCLFPHEMNIWIQTEYDKLKSFIEQETNAYVEEYNRLKSTFTIDLINKFMEKCKNNGMKQFVCLIQNDVIEQTKNIMQSFKKGLEDNITLKAMDLFRQCLQYNHIFGKNLKEINNLLNLMENDLLNKLKCICQNFCDITKSSVETIIFSFDILNLFIDLKADLDLHSQCNMKCNLNTHLINDISTNVETSYESINLFFSNCQLEYQSSIQELNISKLNESLVASKKWNPFLVRVKLCLNTYSFQENITRKSSQKHLQEKWHEIFSKIKTSILYEEIIKNVSNKLKESKHHILNTTLPKVYNKEREQFYKDFVKDVSFLCHSEELRDHLDTNIFDIASYENEVKPFLESIFNKFTESAKNIFDKDSSEITVQDFDLFRHTLENIKMFDIQSKNVGLNFNLSTNVEEITEKLYSTINYFFSMIDAPENNIEDKASWMIKIKLFANNLPEFSEEINSRLDLVLKSLIKKKNQQGVLCGVDLAMLSIALEQEPSGVGFNIISEHSIFKGQVICIFNENTKFNGISYVLKNLEGDDINAESLERLNYVYEQYYHVYKSTIKKFILRLPEKNVLKELVRSIKITGDKLSDNKKCKWDEIDRTRMCQLVASILALWTLQNAEYYNEMKDVVNRDSYLLTPHPSQVVSIFRILGIGYFKPREVKSLTGNLKKIIFNEKSFENISNDKLQNNLVQVGTGEGKSFILAVVSCVLSLIGFEVSCACYSEYLSSRDYESFLPLFSSLNLTNHIRYATFNTICEDVINQNCDIRNQVTDIVSNKQVKTNLMHNNSQRSMILLIDEVDVFFNKSFYGNLYRPLARLKNPSINRLTGYIWSEKSKKLTLKQIQSTPEYQECCSCFEGWNFLIEEAVKDMLVDVQDFKHDYFVKNDMLAYKEQDGISYNVVYGYKTLFAYYFEHDQGRISLKSLNEAVSIGIKCGSFSFAEIPHSFSFITGVTGTLKTLSESERKIVKSYEINKFTIIPSLFGDNKRRFAKHADIYIENENDYLPKLQEHIEYSMVGSNINHKRPVLVFFSSKGSLLEFYNSKWVLAVKENIQIITEEVSESSKEKEMLIKRATMSGQITFLTRVFGRGTDFVCSDQNVIANGGVHVVQTFFSEEFSEEIQIQGRTARQGKDGSYSMVLLDSDLEKYLGIDFRSKIDVLRNERNFYDNLNLNRNDLFNSSYLNIQKLVSEVKKEHDLGRVFVENLNNCEIDEVKTFLRERNIGSALSLNASRTVCLMDATGSMGGLLSKAKSTVGTMFERASTILIDHGIPSDSFQMQFAVYRDYDRKSEELLQYSPWETKPDNLRKFMDTISARGGQGEEAVEIGLWHVNRVNKENEVNQVILIGDAPANPQEQIKANRKIHGKAYWKTTDFKEPTFYRYELDELKKNKIVVHAFFLDERAKSNFQEIASETGGQCGLLEIDSSKGADVLTDIVTREILRNVGQLRGKGNALVKAYNARYTMSQAVYE